VQHSAALCSTAVLPLLFAGFIKLQFLYRFSNTKFHENPSSGNRVVPYGRTDGRTDIRDAANSRFSQFYEND
jgi:hypothetical protein